MPLATRSTTNPSWLLCGPSTTDLWLPPRSQKKGEWHDLQILATPSGSRRRRLRADRVGFRRGHCGRRRRGRRSAAHRLHAQRNGRSGADHKRRLRYVSPGEAGRGNLHDADAAGANVNTDCETTLGPHNETSIAVNPTNPDNIIGGANDYQLGLNPGGHVSETVLSRAHVSFDGGKTWSEYPLNANSTYQATGDPAVAFDADGHAYYATLGFRFVGPGNAQNPDVLVSNSGDGGKTWDTSESPREAASGRASVTCWTRSTSRRGGTGTRSSPSATSVSARRAHTSAAASTAPSRTTTARRGRAPQLISGDLDDAVRVGANGGVQRTHLRSLHEHRRPDHAAGTRTTPSR